MIEIKKVSKRFDKIEAVSDVSLSIEEGQYWYSIFLMSSIFSQMRHR